ncbi:MAG TPA: hypothetical protein VNH42_05140 [Mariprofundaceae bacterium]|nr:hypothetical protein [Mariprofundaceae bacterium]
MVMDRESAARSLPLRGASPLLLMKKASLGAMACAVAAVICAACLGSGPAQAADWVRYTAPDRSFAVSLPMTPTVEAPKEGRLLLSTANAEDTESYVVDSMQLKGPEEDIADRLFTSAIDAIVRIKKTTILSQQRHQVFGHPADDIKMRSLEGYYIWERMMVVDDHFYQFLHVTTTEEDAPARFWDSFVLRP